MELSSHPSLGYFTDNVSVIPVKDENEVKAVDQVPSGQFNKISFAYCKLYYISFEALFMTD